MNHIFKLNEFNKAIDPLFDDLAQLKAVIKRLEVKGIIVDATVNERQVNDYIAAKVKECITQ